MSWQQSEVTITVTQGENHARVTYDNNGNILEQGWVEDDEVTTAELPTDALMETYATWERTRAWAL